MEFKRYMSLKRVGTQETQGLLQGKCYIFPKLDGTNANVWLENGEVKAGSRNRILDESSSGDNAGFCKWVAQQSNIKKFLEDFPQVRLYGEWLVPHSIKNYAEEAWKKFYVFDMYDESLERHIPYEVYSELMANYGIDYIPVQSIIVNPTKDQLLQEANRNTYLTVSGIGEGIVVKNYDFVNKYGRTVWGKIVTDEFKVKHKKEMKSGHEEVRKSTEEEIVDKFCTEAFIVKEYNKMLLKLENNGEEWSGKHIPQLLGEVYWEFIREESYEFIKAHKRKAIDFRNLNGLVTMKIKETLKNEIF